MTHDTKRLRPPAVATRGAPPGRRRRLPRWGAATAVLVALAAATPLGAEAPAAADDLAFPFSTGFATAAGGTLSGDARIVDGRLRLTDAVFRAAGAWAMDDSFPSDRGLDIEFDYAMYTPDEQGADGLLLSLADGSVPPGVGAFGSALGYSCRDEVSQGQSTCTLPGLPGAFAAIALDQYGNFSLPFNDSGPGRTPETVTVRGSGNGLTGYRFVQHAEIAGGVATGTRTTRKVHVVLQPEDDGLTVTVQLSAAGGETGPCSTTCSWRARDRHRCRRRSAWASPGAPARSGVCTRSTPSGWRHPRTSASSTTCHPSSPGTASATR